MYTIYVNGAYHASWSKITDAIADYNACIAVGYGMVELYDPADERILYYHE